MSNRKLSLLAFPVMFAAALNAQTFNDALRFSTFDAGSTARSMGVGGALGAFGADFSVLSSNPAGIGWYRGSEFHLTPSLMIANTESRLLNDEQGRPRDDGRSAFGFNSVGIIIASRPRSANWSGFNFGIGLNRLANFNQEFSYRGFSQGSIVDRFLEQANGGQFGAFESNLAIETEAVYELTPGSDFFGSDFELTPNAIIRRQQEVTTRGGISELVFSFGGNYKERLLVGATVGVPFLNYNESKDYQENDDNAEVPFFRNLAYSERLNITGTGVNLKLGMIYRASQAFRMGFAVHTPTAFSLSESYRTEMEYSYNTQPDDSGQIIENRALSPDGLFEYRLRTPWRLIGSLGYLYEKNGFLSAELEWVNFANNQFRFPDFPEDERALNAVIANELESAWNLRLGGELAMEAFRFRAGLGFQQSPLANDNSIATVLSAGVGVRGRSAFLDLAYQRRSAEDEYRPYLTSGVLPEQVVENLFRRNHLVLTLGFRF
jgi:hypothetical protein